MTDWPPYTDNGDENGEGQDAEWNRTFMQSIPPNKGRDSQDNLPDDEATRPDDSTRSEDIPPPLTSKELTYDNCRRVEWEVAQLRRQYDETLITRDDLKAQLRNLMLRDSRGRWWMIGVESNQWYVREDDQWVPDTPPVSKPEPTPPPEPPTMTMDFPAAPPESTPPAESTPGMEVAGEDEHIGEPPPSIQDEAQTVINDNVAYRFEPAVTEVGGEDRPPPEAEPTVQHFPPPQGPPPDQQPTIPHPVDFVDFDPAEHEPPDEPGPRPRFTRDILLRFAVLLGGVLLAALVVFFSAVLLTTFFVINRYSEQIAALPDTIAKSQTTRIFDAQLNLVAELNDAQGRRVAVPLENISPYMIHATISVENERFYEDPGYDLIAITRALLQNFLSGEIQSGASTITQQVVRWAVLPPESRHEQTPWRKVQEIILAAELGRRYSKNEILYFYLNSVFYGNLAYGVEAAAQTYFDKTAFELEPAEAAFLAGLPQAPAYYDPVIHLERAIERMDTVLELMATANGDGCIQFQHGKWAEDNVPICVKPEDWETSQAQVKQMTFHVPTVEMVYPHFALYVQDWLEEAYGEEFFAKGYDVYTTLDPRIQDLAQENISEQIINMSYAISNAAIVAIRPQDGAIRAMVGSADYKSQAIQGQVNMAVSPRQPGSSIKPFVYLATMQMNQNWWTPATIIWDVPTVYEDNYKPRNYDGQYHGPVAMRYALGNSYNVPAVKAYAHAGWERFHEVTQNFGLTLHGDETNTGLSVALGAREVTLLDMVSAYATLANGGKRFEPYAVTRILDRDGREFYTHNIGISATQAIAPAYAFLITDILSDPSARVAAFGPNNLLSLPDNRPAAVKTGTTGVETAIDAWTIGYTPHLAVGVWVGNADRRPIPGITGYVGATPIWRATMYEALQVAGKPAADFPIPSERLVQIDVCSDTGAHYSSECRDRRPEWFEVDHPPPPADEDFLVMVEVDSLTGLIANQWCPNNVERRRYLQLEDPWAVRWINETQAGRAWAEEYGVSVPLKSPPTQECDPNTQPATVVITSPTSNQEVSGVVNVYGTISMPNFHRYQLEMGAGTAPIDWGLVWGPATVLPAAGAPLAQWDTTRVADGVYTIRIIAFDEAGGNAESRVVVNVRNTVPMTATPIPTNTFFPTATPLPTETTTATPSETPFVAPTETPVPTLTLPPTLTLTMTPTETPVP